MPAEVSKVKYASKVITNDADIPEAIGSNFFVIFICVFSLVGLYTVMELKKPLNFVKSLPIKLNRFYYKRSKKSFIVNNKSTNKKKFNPVTNLDKSFEKFIRSLITKSFPKDGIMGEEFDDKESSNDYKWSIDPIDGTKAFIVGIPTWSNLIGLMKEENSIIGLANFPELNSYYFNDKEKSYLNKNEKKIIIKSSNKINLKNIKIIANFHEQSNKKDNIRLIKKFSKSIKLASIDALSYCLLAEGKIDAVIETSLKPFDIIPLIPIVRNAGGCITNWKNKPAEKGGNILATSNRKLHKKILRMINSLNKTK